MSFSYGCGFWTGQKQKQGQVHPSVEAGKGDVESHKIRQ